MQERGRVTWNLAAAPPPASNGPQGRPRRQGDGDKPLSVRSSLATRLEPPRLQTGRPGEGFPLRRPDLPPTQPDTALSIKIVDRPRCTSRLIREREKTAEKIADPFQ